MRLHFESFGAGFPVVILHGLFGSGDNWLRFARELEPNHRVVLPDHRNHGRSPHAGTMTHAEMAQDVRELMQHLGLAEAHVIGHSLGGKTAMQMALDHPELVRSLVVVDIAPRKYEGKHDAILDALLGLDLGSLSSRQEIEIALAPAIPDLQVRRFLLKGIERTAEGFRWRMGIREIADNYSTLSEAVSGERAYEGPCMFVRGELSTYLLPGDEPGIRSLFPKAEFATVAKASHWVHADNPEGFNEAVLGFLEQV
jgi:pimeloyl-ACP methyl ester carboxylesterase